MCRSKMEWCFAMKFRAIPGVGPATNLRLAMQVNTSLEKNLEYHEFFRNPTTIVSSSRTEDGHMEGGLASFGILLTWVGS